MTDTDRRHPEFAIAIRGYDRDQVDDYVRRLRELLAVAENRARVAEAEARRAAGVDQRRDSGS